MICLYIVYKLTYDPDNRFKKVLFIDKENISIWLLGNFILLLV